MSNRPIKINIGPKITETTHRFLGSLFGGTPNRGAQLALESFRPLYRMTMNRLAGRFEKGELLLMIDVMNGTWIVPEIAGQMLPANVHDGIDINQLDGKWGIDGDALKAKIKALSPFETWCLELWSVGFWSQLSQDLSAPDSSDKWVAFLLADEQNTIPEAV